MRPNKHAVFLISLLALAIAASIPWMLEWYIGQRTQTRNLAGTWVGDGARLTLNSAGTGDLVIAEVVTNWTNGGTTTVPADEGSVEIHEYSGGYFLSVSGQHSGSRVGGMWEIEFSADGENLTMTSLNRGTYGSFRLRKEPSQPQVSLLVACLPVVCWSLLGVVLTCYAGVFAARRALRAVSGKR